MSALFITATGTEIGKTYVTGLLTRQLRAGGQSPLALKPVISGYSGDPEEESDTGHLLDALGRPRTPEDFAALSPWAFQGALSPDMAGAREGRTIDYAALLEFCRGADETHPGPVLVEGVGGAMVPLDADHLVLDWMADLDWPTLVVAGAYLGTISHTLTTLAALESRAIRVNGLVLSEAVLGPVPLEETAASIARFAPGVPIALLPRNAARPPDLTAFLSP